MIIEKTVAQIRCVVTTALCAALALLLLYTPSAALAQAGPAKGPLKLLALGDSLTFGLGLARDQAYPTLLQKKFDQAGLPVKVINAGVSGDTVADGLARLDWALAENPRVALVALGANDALRGMSPQRAKQGLAVILKKLRDKGVLVLLAGMYAPPNLGAEYSEAFNRIYPELAKEFGVDFYPFILEGVGDRPELNQPDGLHPNPRGAAEMAKRLYPALEPLVKKALAGR